MPIKPRVPAPGALDYVGHPVFPAKAWLGVVKGSVDAIFAQTGAVPRPRTALHAGPLGGPRRGATAGKRGAGGGERPSSHSPPAPDRAAAGRHIDPRGGAKGRGKPRKAARSEAPEVLGDTYDGIAISTLPEMVSKAGCEVLSEVAAGRKTKELRGKRDTLYLPDGSLMPVEDLAEGQLYIMAERDRPSGTDDRVLLRFNSAEPYPSRGAAVVAGGAEVVTEAMVAAATRACNARPA